MERANLDPEASYSSRDSPIERGSFGALEADFGVSACLRQFIEGGTSARGISRMLL
jgi:hypothetical protein